MHPQLKFITKGDRLYEGDSESAMSTTGYANAPIAEFNRRCDRLYEGDSKSAMSTTGYANAPIAEFNRRCDRTKKNYENLNF
ncbi:MAG: hypothetical protein V7K88_14720 [Nostoc sp.]|uniref:hypothetical protein n=1 Tax=Nostoc sp. TaxID=1180 RepID=UPI002FF78195